MRINFAKMVILFFGLFFSAGALSLAYISHSDLGVETKDHLVRFIIFGLGLISWAFSLETNFKQG